MPLLLLLAYPYRKAVDWDAADADMCKTTLAEIQQGNKLQSALFQAKDFGLFSGSVERDYVTRCAQDANLPTCFSFKLDPSPCQTIDECVLGGSRPGVARPASRRGVARSWLPPPTRRPSRAYGTRRGAILRSHLATVHLVCT